MNAATACLVCLMCLAADPPSNSDQTATDSGAILDGPVLIGRWRVAGKPSDFMVSTASAYTTLDTSRVGALTGPAVETPLGTGTPPFSIPAYKAPVIQAADRTWKLDWVLKQDIEFLTEILGRETSGILGMDALRSVVLDLNFKTRRFEIRPTIDSASLRDYLSVPLTISPTSGLSTIVMNLPNLGPTEFLVNTGGSLNGSGGLTREVIESLSNAGAALELVSWPGPTPDGEGRLITYQIKGHTRFADVAFEDLLFDRGGANDVNIHFFSRFSRVIFDFPGGKLYLKKGPDLHKPDLIQRSGLAFTKKAGNYRVLTVRSGTPAFRAGVEVNDKLVTVNGRPTAEMEANTIRIALSGPVVGDGKLHTVRLGFQRGDKSFEATLDLTTWPEIDLTPPKRLPPDLQPAR